MDVSWTQGLIIQSCQSFYHNLQSFYNKHNYVVDYIWNFDETCIQIRRQSKARVPAKRGSHQVYNTIPKSKEWLIVNYVVNVVGITLLWFYIFRGKTKCDDYVQLCKLRACMAMQLKAWMTTFLFKEFLFFFKRSTPNGISITNRHPLFWTSMDPMSPLRQLNELKSYDYYTFAYISCTSTLKCGLF